MDITNLKAYLPFESPAITRDFTGQTTWTATGNVASSTTVKQIGDASVYLPNGACLTASNVIDINADKWTFDCWCYLVSSSKSNGYFSLSSNTSGGSGRYGIVVGNDGIYVAHPVSGWQAQTDSVLFPSVKNQWVHLAIVKNGTNVTFYQDGQSVWSFTTSQLNNNGTFILGGNWYGYDTEIYFDSVRFYEGTALWTDNFTPPAMADYLSPDIPPKFLSFTGNSGCYAKLPLSLLPGATTFTIEAMLATNSTKNYSKNYQWATIAGREIGYYYQNDFGLCVNNGKLCFWSEPAQNATLARETGGVFSDAVINDGAVHKVAVVSSGGAISLYCDGNRVAYTANVNAKITNAYSILLGYNTDANSYLQMDLYEARFWNVARTQEQIFADIDGTETGLQGWYLPSSEGLKDYSGNARHATLYGSPAYHDLSVSSYFFDLQRTIKNAALTWRYENAGDADDLILTAPILTDLPATKSKTGTAFYQTTRAKCFDLPATAEVWMKFDVYFNGSNRWRAYNEGSAGFCGVCSYAGATVDFGVWQNATKIQAWTGICKTNQLQTVLLHMKTGASDGIVEAWVDGNFIHRYTGNVNQGSDFADIYLQSDGSGTFFSNVIISNAPVGLNDGFQIFTVDVARHVKNRVELYLDVARNVFVIQPIVVPLIGEHFNHYVQSLSLIRDLTQRIILPKTSKVCLRALGAGAIEIFSDTNTTGKIVGTDVFIQSDMYAALDDCNTVFVKLAPGTSPQQVIRLFIKNLERVHTMENRK